MCGFCYFHRQKSTKRKLSEMSADDDYTPNSSKSAKKSNDVSSPEHCSSDDTPRKKCGRPRKKRNEVRHSNHATDSVGYQFIS